MRVGRFRGRRAKDFVLTNILHPPDLADAKIEELLVGKQESKKRGKLDPPPHEGIKSECEEKG